MSGPQFAKFAKECPTLMDKKVITSTEVDLIFASTKSIGANSLTYKEFGEAMKKMAAKKFPKVNQLRRFNDDDARVILLSDNHLLSKDVEWYVVQNCF